MLCVFDDKRLNNDKSWHSEKLLCWKSNCLIPVYLKPVKNCHFIILHFPRIMFSLVAILFSNITVVLYIRLWYKINLISVDNSLVIYSLGSKVLVERNQCLLAQTHRTLTWSPITFSIRFSSFFQTRLTLKTCEKTSYPLALY